MRISPVLATRVSSYQAKKITRVNSERHKWAHVTDNTRQTEINREIANRHLAKPIRSNSK
jgi:hypothetical protein